ncbi:MAG TPA: peptidoglycan-associated lipoprotein Pal [Gemmatimonadales bacterium]|nr:peptidoglycan-associated lipoprotein Pal [Gemmatimonadales bacterium]
MTRAMILGLAAAAALAACGGKQEPELPTPEPAPTTAPAPPAPAPTNDNAERERLERERREAEERAKAVTADLGAMIHFDYDRSDVRAEDGPNLDRKAAILEANPAVRVRISGHADERGSDEYNLALGTRRAAAAKRYLENKGVDGSRLEVISYGEERPLSGGADETAYANNRRDEFEITAGGGNLVAPR